MNLARDAVLSENPNFMNLGLLSFHTSDEFGSVFILTAIIRRPTDWSNWLLSGHHIVEVTADRMSGTRPEQKYNSKSDFETRRGGVVHQDFGCQNISMSQPPLELTPLGTNTSNGTTSPIDLILVEKKSPEPTILTLPMYLPEKNRKAHVPGDPDPDQSSSDSSSNKYNLSNDTNSSKLN